MKSKGFLSIAAIIIVSWGIMSCASIPLVMPGAEANFNDPPAPRFTSVCVHDPSIFYAGNGEYYVIGSHIATAKTSDFIQWQQVTLDWNNRRNQFSPVDNPNPAIQTMAQQIADVMRGADHEIGFYAADIHRMPDGRFFHYYCLTSSWKCSAIGLAIADKVDGPYVTQGLIVRSDAAASGNLTPDGSMQWSVARHPNCIDPAVFWCKNKEKFYMTYGSWSGGIFIFEMDPVTGFPKAGVAMNEENQGYGRKLIRNSHVSVEAPYIIYSPHSDYYYLFVSYGWLAADGGYSLRVFRSRNPYGPYDDAKHPGIDMGTRDFIFSQHAEYGNKIIGPYQFRTVRGESSIVSTGYLSPGHNSAYYCAKTDRYLMVFHTRFVGRGEQHEVRVHEMFINEDGWLVVAPFRYDGGTIRTFTKDSLVGTWKVLNHQRDINTDPHRSVVYQFLENGDITNTRGGNAGTWVLGEDSKTAHITIDGVLYKGVFLRNYDNDKRRWVQAFTAQSEDGIALWGAGVSLN
jgi:arabinan endo-1,5-alpha-L-arabinosidase